MKNDCISQETVRHGYWIHKKSHMWFLDEEGEPDLWRYEWDFHNGPECQACNKVLCVHCHPDFMEDECECGHYVCSECGEQSVGMEDFCPNCNAMMDMEAKDDDK